MKRGGQIGVHQFMDGVVRKSSFSLPSNLIPCQGFL